ncbi:MAG: hypothetical protein ACHQFZ_00480 [Acidimicrobiales bacterium]
MTPRTRGAGTEGEAVATDQAPNESDGAEATAEGEKARPLAPAAKPRPDSSWNAGATRWAGRSKGSGRRQERHQSR